MHVSRSIDTVLHILIVANTNNIVCEWRYECCLLSYNITKSAKISLAVLMYHLQVVLCTCLGCGPKYSF